MCLQPAVIAACLLSPLSACTAGPKESPGAPGEVGDVVQDLGDKLWIVFQDKKNTYWFGSDGEGVYRVDGRDILRYTTQDGLCNDHIRQILEDESGSIYFNTLGGISKFDGQRFSTLVPIEGSASEWKLEPGDLWFRGNGPYRYDGKSLYRLEFPKHELEDLFNSKFPGVPYSPYEVYTIYKDSKGSIWFGTSSFGACRYDGNSFTWISEPELVELEDGPSFGIRAIVEDGDGRFWLSYTLHRYDVPSADPMAQDKTAIKYRQEPGIGASGPYVADDYSYFTSAVKDEQGSLWLATYGAGVWRYDGEHLTHYPVQENGKTVLLYSIYEDQRGVLWLGTTESGVYRFNGEAFERFRP